MKRSRLEQLYQQKLVSPEVHAKTLPLARILTKPMRFFPDEPAKADYDILEIGPGRGDFLFNLCETNPDQSVVAVEIGHSRFTKLVSQHKKRAVKNLTLIHADIRIPLEKHFANNQFKKVFVLFPDPWPRNRHRHKRLLQTDFLKTLVQKMRKDASFILATDVEDYARWAFQNLSSLENMKNTFLENVLKNGLPPEVIPTFFSEKWQKIGRDFWWLCFAKI